MNIKWTVRVLLVVLATVASLVVLVPSSADAVGRRIIVREGESIQAALDSAPPYSTVIVAPGLYEEALRIRTDGIKLRGRRGAVLRTPEDAESECREFGAVISICIVESVSNDELGLLVGSGLISDVSVSGFTIEDSPASAIGALAAENITVTSNTIRRAGCDGVFTADVSRVRISLNSISDTSQSYSFCTGIIVTVGSENGIVSNNRIRNSEGTGIAVTNGNNSNVLVQRNRVLGNCGGVLVTGDATADGDVSSGNRVTANRIENNNRACRIFADIGFPDLIWGGFGVMVSGAQDTSIHRNIIRNNVVDEPTATAGGIRIQNGQESPIGAVSINVNRVTGNTVAGEALDINIVDGIDLVGFRRNVCGVSLPDPQICGG